MAKEDSLIIEKFINQTIPSDTNSWSITTVFNVLELDPDNVSLFINGLKIDDAALSISDVDENKSEITFKQIDYDIDVEDVFEIHYFRKI